jgi:predicted small lipoprotein YifL
MNKRASSVVVTLTTLVAVLLLPGCGQKGPLTLPEAAAPAGSAGSVASGASGAAR